jgi:hypothetical protein
MMETWLRERILHRYVLENAKFRPFGKKIISVKDNKDRYPYIFCILKAERKFKIR